LTRQIGQFGAPQLIMTKGLLTAQSGGTARLAYERIGHPSWQLWEALSGPLAARR